MASEILSLAAQSNKTLEAFIKKLLNETNINLLFDYYGQKTTPLIFAIGKYDRQTNV